MQWGRDNWFFFFFKSARNVFNEEEVNYDNYSEWSDPWTLLISIYCLDYRTIRVKPNCDCPFTLKTWKGNGESSLRPPPSPPRGGLPVSPPLHCLQTPSLWKHTHMGLSISGPFIFFCARFMFAWASIASGDWWQAKHFGHNTIWRECYQLRELSNNKELKLHAP